MRVRAVALLCTWILPLAARAAEGGGRASAAIARDPMSAGGVVQMVAGLALVVVLIFALAWAVRRFGAVGMNSGGALRVVGGLSMGARERVVLVQVGDKQILLGVAPGRVQTLHVLDTPVGASDGGERSPGFAERLRGVMNGGRP